MGACDYAPDSGWTINGLAGDKLHHQREFPPHLVPGKVATLCRLSSFAHSSKPLQVSEVDGASSKDAGLQKKNGRRAGGDKYSTVRGAGETQNHSTVLCLDRFGVAR